jgi:hypothetical protein
MLLSLAWSILRLLILILEGILRFLTKGLRFLLGLRKVQIFLRWTQWFFRRVFFILSLSLAFLWFIAFFVFIDFSRVFTCNIVLNGQNCLIMFFISLFIALLMYDFPKDQDTHLNG